MYCELFWGVRAALEELARRTPLVVVFDDIHWAEATFLDLIENILDASLSVPLLLVCTARHELREDRPRFAAGRRAASQIELGELSREESGLVVRNLLGEASLPGPLERRILRLAEGNPLFIEQMLSMLIDDGSCASAGGPLGLLWVRQGDLGSGKRLVLAGCPPRPPRVAERRVVESASVIGLEFSSDAVAVLVQEDNDRTDLEPPLAALCRKKLIRRAEAGAADDFHFSHILIRDAAYARLLKRTRAGLHERFAAWLADMVGSRVAEYEEILGYHLEQSLSLPGGARTDRRRRAAARRRGVAPSELRRSSRLGPRRHAGGGEPVAAGRRAARRARPRARAAPPRRR